MDLKSLTEKKVAGIPVLYIGAVFVVILAVVAWRMKTPAGVPDAEVAAGDAPAEGDAAAPEERIPPFVANPPATGSPVPDPGGIGQVDDNDQWMRRSIEWLAGQSHATADQATIAIQKYLAGDQLSIAEGRLRDLAISHFGLPPEIPTSGGTVDPVVPTPPPTNPPPTNPPPTAPPKVYKAPTYHTVTGTSDDSYTDMARLYYKRTDNASIDLIQSYNVTKAHEGPFAKGSRFWIPAWHAPKYATAKKGMQSASEFVAKNQPLNSVKMLQELNDGMKFPVKIGTKVRVA